MAEAAAAEEEETGRAGDQGDGKGRATGTERVRARMRSSVAPTVRVRPDLMVEVPGTPVSSPSARGSNGGTGSTGGAGGDPDSESHSQVLARYFSPTFAGEEDGVGSEIDAAGGLNPVLLHRAREASRAESKSKLPGIGNKSGGLKRLLPAGHARSEQPLSPSMEVARFLEVSEGVGGQKRAAPALAALKLASDQQQRTMQEAYADSRRALVRKPTFSRDNASSGALPKMPNAAVRDCRRTEPAGSPIADCACGMTLRPPGRTMARPGSARLPRGRHAAEGSTSERSTGAMASAVRAVGAAADANADAHQERNANGDGEKVTLV